MTTPEQLFQENSPPATVSDHDAEFSKMANEMGVGGAYERKVALINRAIKEEIGYGRFQYRMTWLCAYGWAMDNTIFQCLSMSLPQIQLEFKPKHVQFATLSLYVGLFFGATLWGLAADVMGRRLAWNLTLLFTGIFALAVGAAPNFIGLRALLAVEGLALGGQLPLDGVALIEFLPSSHQWIMTLLSVSWCLGSLFAAFIGWAFVTNYRCESADFCPRDSNQGWRYTWFFVGGVGILLWIARFFIYPMPESPKYLVGVRRDAEALAVIQFIAKENGKTTSLTLEQLRAAGNGITTIPNPDDIENHAATDSFAETPCSDCEKKENEAETEKEKDTTAQVHHSSNIPGSKVTEVVVIAKGWKRFSSNLGLTGHSLSEFDSSHITALFSTYKMAWSTTLICLLWGMIGLAYPLYNAFLALYLQSVGAHQGETSQYSQYRDMVIISACGIPGSLIATWLVELPYLGRRGSMALSTALTDVFLFLFTTARTPQAILGWNCATSLTQNAMYAVLYHMTYELFPAPHRGTGDGLAMGVQRVFGVIAPLVGVYAGTSPGKPIYVSASFFITASVLMLLLPYETRGRTAL